ncbi:unnamed protein product [Adineta steineri]|uniref:Uncharacterized protein n=1 Tax=Adineta steineri TaxID=433720 RepID=A0A814LIA3_9BILA|nr:unnamed protein product [Adineta steineri]CAF1068412.1 unnamed protein product [Adineta steineri]CAF4057671.1 unnamed protein product [Adineta steineri]
MATAVLPNDDFHTNIDDKSLEIFSLIWLDTNVNVKDIRDTEVKLRSIINHIKKFQDVKQCQHYIEQTSQKDRLVIIVSGRLGQEIVPYIHQLRQVISIYVYCIDKKSNEQWAYKFAKIKSVVVDLDELVSQITADHKIQKKVEEPLSINIFTTNVGAGKSILTVNGQFVFSQILIDCLLRLKSTDTDKNELINCCQNEYKGNRTELNNLREFEEDYSPDKALWWYTKETFFYKTLNAALRTHNIHMIFLFRAYIYDIHRQLQNYQSKKFERVFRSQLMSNDELNSLKQNIGQFISINSFFSTTDERETALFLLGDITTKIDSERVLFEIDADPTIVNIKPFANISRYSYFPGESEVLFMIGSIFRLNSISHDNDNIWIIKMTLYNDDEHDLKQVLMYMKQQIENEQTNLRTLGNVLWEMGEFDLAEKYLTRLLKQLPSNDPLHISLYEDLGKLASQGRKLDMSMKWRQKLLTFKKENPLATNSSINKTNNSINEPHKMHVGPHNGYSIKKTTEFIIKYAPYLRTTLQVTQVLFKLGGFVIPQLDSVSEAVGSGVDTILPTPDKQKEMEQQLNLVEKLLDRVDHEWTQSKSTMLGQDKSRGVPLQGPDLREVETYLDVADNRRSLGNLYRTVTADGHVRWVCLEHYDGISFNNAMSKYIDQLEDMGGQSIFFNPIIKWEQYGVTIAGGNGPGNQFNQLSYPQGIYVDDDHQTIYIADHDNDRVVEWKYGAKNGQVVAGGNGKGNRSDQLLEPTDVVVDKKNDSLIICDYGNRRVVRWSRQDGRNGETIISDIECRGLTMDKNGDLYISDVNKNEVRRWKQGEREGTIVAGGNTYGNHLNQLRYPTYIFVDGDHSVYVSDYYNHRVMKWMKGAKKGIVVAGGNGHGNSLTQLSNPQGVTVDHLGNVCVADLDSHRIMRWCKGSCEGSIVVGGNEKGEQPNQFSCPSGLAFDIQGNLYVVDGGNHRIQKFEIDFDENF